MNKTAIKSFAIEARTKLISEITYKAGLVGITKDGISEPIHKADGIEMYNIGASKPYTINGEQLKQRKNLASRVKEKGFDNVIEEVAYTWFNRIIAVRFMEVNDYLPTGVRVLSSEINGKTEPDLVTNALNVDLGYTPFERDEIIRLKDESKLDELFRMLFIKQCNKLNEILPELFEKTSDYTELLLSIAFTIEDSIVRLLIDKVEEDDFKEQVEIIGWMYQYYNTELKDDTFTKLKANIKITKERIPAATQLFTPDWIVRYMVENSLGRLWIEHLQASEDKLFNYGKVDYSNFTYNTVTNQQKIDSIKSNWKYYLDEAEQEPDVKIQLEKLRADRKNIRPEDIKIIDPCMGSGHILVYAFDVLMDIYKSCGYEEREAVKHILQNNLYGIDIDDRAYQFAYFAVMMKARGYSRRILNEGIMPNLCSIQESNGLSEPRFTGLQDLHDYFVQGLTEIEKVRVGADFEYLIEVFLDAKEYGSILDVKEIDFDTIERRIEEIKAEGAFDFFAMQYRNLILENVVPLVKQAKIMAQKYDVVVTNPPYMGGSGMGLKLAEYVKKNYSDSKSDLFAVFIEKCLEMLKNNGYQAMITQHAWMFLSSYEKLRKKLLLKDTINMAHLGARAFEEIGGEVVQTTIFVVKNSNIKDYKATYVRLVDFNSQQTKEEAFLSGGNRHIAQKENFSKIPGMPIAYWVSENFIRVFDSGELLGNFAEPRLGMATADNSRFIRFWNEVDVNKCNFRCKSREESIVSNKKWFPYNKGGEFRKWYGNNDIVVNWENDGEEILNFKDTKTGRIRSHNYNLDYIFNDGLTWTFISSSNFGIRYFPRGCLFDVGGSSVFMKNERIYYTLGYLTSKLAFETLRVCNQL